MREILITLFLLFGLAIATLIAERRASEIATLDEAITVLERELAHTQTMLDDAHRLLPHLEQRVVKVQTDLTAREVIWTLSEALAEQGCEVQIH